MYPNQLGRYSRRVLRVSHNISLHSERNFTQTNNNDFARLLLQPHEVSILHLIVAREWSFERGNVNEFPGLFRDQGIKFPDQLLRDLKTFQYLDCSKEYPLSEGNSAAALGIFKLGILAEILQEDMDSYDKSLLTLQWDSSWFNISYIHFFGFAWFKRSLKDGKLTTTIPLFQFYWYLIMKKYSYVGKQEWNIMSEDGMQFLITHHADMHTRLLKLKSDYPLIGYHDALRFLSIHYMWLGVCLIDKKPGRDYSYLLMQKSIIPPQDITLNPDYLIDFRNERSLLRSQVEALDSYREVIQPFGNPDFRKDKPVERLTNPDVEVEMPNILELLGELNQPSARSDDQSRDVSRGGGDGSHDRGNQSRDDANSDVTQDPDKSLGKAVSDSDSSNRDRDIHLGRMVIGISLMLFLFGTGWWLSRRVIRHDSGDRWYDRLNVWVIVALSTVLILILGALIQLNLGKK